MTFLFEGDRMVRVGRSNADDAMDPHHDVLVLNPDEDLYRFEHVPFTPDFAQSPVHVQPDQPGHRKVLNLARATGHRVAMATFPVKPEPASEFFCCYFTDSGALEPSNVWTGSAARSGTVVLLDPNPANERCFRFRVNAQDRYLTAPEDLTRTDPGLHRALKDFVGTNDTLNTVALALPPATAFGGAVQGRIINPDALSEINPWTAAPWNDHPSIKMFALPKLQVVELLVAGYEDKLLALRLDPKDPRVVEVNLTLEANQYVKRLLETGLALGSVTVPGREKSDLVNLASFFPDARGGGPLRLLLATDPGNILDIELNGTSLKVSPFNVRSSVEVWQMLRNGCVVGCVRLAGEERDVVLVNQGAFGYRTALAADGEVKFVGTLDFKWPAKSRLRVLVKRPSYKLKEEVDFDTLWPAMERLAATWTEGTSLTLAFEPVIAPLEASIGAYDILVDLDELPLDQAGDAPQDGVKPVPMPRSELGSYARRASFGVPTMYLGWVRSVKDPYGKEFAGPQEYFDSAVFRHFLLHEFGHALGLPHLHQHPDLQNPFENEAHIISVLGEAGILVSSAFVQEEMLRRWPGGKTYSDWPELTDAAGKPLSVGALANESVMMGVAVRAVFLNRVSGPQINYRDSLGDMDRLWIRQLYPR